MAKQDSKSKRNRNLPRDTRSIDTGPKTGKIDNFLSNKIDAYSAWVERLEQDTSEAERLEQLEALSSDLDHIEEDSAPNFNPIDEFSEENLDIAKPSVEPERSTSMGFRPTIGTPERSSDKKGSDTKEDSSSSSEAEEPKSLSDIINRSKDKRLEANEKKYSKDRKGLAKLNFVGRGRDKLKKALVAAAISGMAGMAAFVVGLLPTAIESILTSATTSYSNFSTEGIVKKAFNEYFKQDVLLAKCREKGGSFENCNVGSSSRSGLLGRAMDDMRANRMNERLLERGISWDYDPGNNTYTVYRYRGGINPDLVAGGVGFQDFDIFELGQNEGSRYIDSLVRSEINQTSRWKRYFIRGPTLRAMRTRTGSTGCFFLCRTKDSWNNKKKWPKKAFGRLVKQHLLSPGSGLLNKIVDCLISGGESCTTRNVHTYVRGKIAEAAARLFDDEFAEKILRAFDGALDKGVTRFIMEEAMKKLFEWFGKELSSKAAGSIVGVFLIMKAIGKLANAITKLPKILRLKNMMMMALATSTFMVMINEFRRGTMPIADFGAMLSTFIGMGGSRIFASMFIGADSSTAKDGQPYSCNNAEDGGISGTISNFIAPAEMESGDLTCKSFMLNFTPNFVKNPLLQTAASAYEAAMAIPGVSLVESAIDKLEGFASSIIGAIAGVIPGVEELQAYLSNALEPIMSNILGAISPSIVTDVFSGVTSRLAPQGARVFDALAGGSSSINQYITPRDELGGGALSSGQQAELDREIAAQQAQDIQYASFYDRFFNMDYTSGIGPSLLTQVAASAPANYTLASFLNPMNNLSLAFNQASGTATYADSTSVARTISSAFAVPVRGFSSTYIDSIAKGDTEIPDPDSPECQREITIWKEQIEDRTDSTVDGEADDLGFGIPDGTSPCLLAQASLKVLTTNGTKTDDFPQNTSGQADSSGGGSTGDPSNPDKPGSGQCPNVPVTRPNEGKMNDVLIQVVPGTRIDHRADLCLDALAMIQAAAADGVVLNGGGFRTYDEQVVLYNKYLNGTGNLAARPGTSNHETGEAIDFENCGSRSTACYKWLAAHAAEYGYYNLPSESWHWSRTGG